MPFGRKSDQALLYSILHETPEPLTRVRPEIPLQLERIVQKALEKDKLFRYQNMAEILEDLKAVRASGMSVPQPEKSIIVLPFENISADPEQDYFCDGMTEELISDLSKIQFPAGDLAHLLHDVQRNKEGHSRHRPGGPCPIRSGGKRPEGGQQPAHHRPAHRRRRATPTSGPRSTAAPWTMSSTFRRKSPAPSSTP